MSRAIKFRLWYPHDGFGPAYLYPDTESRRPGHVKYGDVLPPRAIRMGAKHPIIHGPGCGSDSAIVEMTLDTETILVGGDITKGCVLEQFTGLKDSKGVDIYEGDIIQGSDPYDTGVVKWADYGDDEYVERLETWMVEMPFRAPLSSMLLSPAYPGRRCRGPHIGPLKVIGNIHDHPHLIPAPTS